MKKVKKPIIHVFFILLIGGTISLPLIIDSIRVPDPKYENIHGQYIFEANDGFIDCFGSVYGRNPFYHHSVWMMSVNQSGSIIYMNFYGDGNAQEWLKQVIPTQDGGYAILSDQGVGDTTGSISSIHLIKVNRSGDIMWEFTYSEEIEGQFEKSMNIYEEDNGNIILLGRTSINFEEIYPTHFWRFNKTGELLLYQQSEFMSPAVTVSKSELFKKSDEQGWFYIDPRFGFQSFDINGNYLGEIPFQEGSDLEYIDAVEYYNASMKLWMCLFRQEDNFHIYSLDSDLNIKWSYFLGKINAYSMFQGRNNEILIGKDPINEQSEARLLYLNLTSRTIRNGSWFGPTYVKDICTSDSAYYFITEYLVPNEITVSYNHLLIQKSDPDGIPLWELEFTPGEFEILYKEYS